jgi:hypothetical protein
MTPEQQPADGPGEQVSALRASSGPGRWVGADLRGAALAGVTLRGLDLSGAQLQESDLRGARLLGVALSGANLSGADLTGAELERVEATGLDASGCRAAGSVWRQSIMLGARLAGADLAGARLSGCPLDRADLAAANLEGAALVGCGCDAADFGGARLADLETVDSTFRDAKLLGAHRLLGSRELVVELLRRDVDTEDAEAMALLGQVMVQRRWCYAEWNRHLGSPDLLPYRTLALTILSKYPESGAGAALEAGLDWRR